VCGFEPEPEWVVTSEFWSFIKTLEHPDMLLIWMRNMSRKIQKWKLLPHQPASLLQGHWDILPSLPSGGEREDLKRANTLLKGSIMLHPLEDQAHLAVNSHLRISYELVLGRQWLRG
jgi:hypothetical protein